MLSALWRCNYEHSDTNMLTMLMTENALFTMLGYHVNIC